MDTRRCAVGFPVLLREQKIPFVVAEQNREIVESLRNEGIPAVSGGASEAAVLIQAHVARAAMLVIAIPDTLHIRKMVEIVRALNPAVAVVLRTHNEDEAELLQAENLGQVFLGERELARNMAAHVVANLRGT